MRTDRECGTCTMCCKLLGVPELEKPQDKWCRHTAKGKGCSIYETRPASCRNFSCLWLQGGWPEEFRPDKTAVVPSATVSGDNIVLYVDPGYPLAYKEPAIQKIIDRLVAKGIIVFIRCGTKRSLYKTKGVLEDA